MSRSINGDGGNTAGVALIVMDQIENKQYEFDGELVLYEQVFAEPVTASLQINLLYSWVNCTRASRFYLHVGDAVFACGVGDSVTHLNQIEKTVTILANDFKVVLKKDAKADKNDTIEIKKFSFIKLTVL
jgi:hypothetical protein